mmetsp:Transcript_36196/g.84827  ORF Transcript_36196/g.84827 Transcript_36196/m.84827 type:complete len:317 (-) Transcript_36196:1143-2093(-)
MATITPVTSGSAYFCSTPTARQTCFCSDGSSSVSSPGPCLCMWSKPTSLFTLVMTFPASSMEGRRFIRTDFGDCGTAPFGESRTSSSKFRRECTCAWGNSTISPSLLSKAATKAEASFARAILRIKSSSTARAAKLSLSSVRSFSRSLWHASTIKNLTGVFAAKFMGKATFKRTKAAQILLLAGIWSFKSVRTKHASSPCAGSTSSLLAWESFWTPSLARVSRALVTCSAAASGKPDMVSRWSTASMAVPGLLAITSIATESWTTHLFTSCKPWQLTFGKWGVSAFTKRSTSSPCLKQRSIFHSSSSSSFRSTSMK